MALPVEGSTKIQQVQEIQEVQQASSTSSNSAGDPLPPDDAGEQHQAKQQQQHELSVLESVETRFGQRPDCFKNTLQEISFVFMATVAVATASFFNGAAVIITVPVSQDLGMTQGQISWITAASSLVAGAFQLALGQLADLLGRKSMFIIGLGGFSALSLLLAFSQNPFWMLIVCGLLGIPAAMIVPPAIGILGAAYSVPSKRKNAAFAAFSAGNPLGFVFGTILCGIATQLANWRASFIMLSIIWAVFTVFGLWAVPNVENFEKAPLRERMRSLKDFDYVGTILTVFGMGMFTASLTLGPEDGWAAPQVIALLVVGVLLLVLFPFWERIFNNPLMPPHIWKDRNFSLIIIAVLFGMMGFTASGFWIAYYMQQLQRLSTLTVAVHLLPMAIAGLLWNVVASRILHIVNNTLIMVFGGICFLAASLLFSFMSPDSSYWAFIFPALVLNVAGADLQYNVGNMYVMQSLPRHQQSLAGGIFNVVQRLAQTAIMGISTAVFSSIELSPESIADPSLKYARTFQVCAAFAGVGLLFCPFIRLGTQGNSPSREEESSGGDKDGVKNAAGEKM